MIPRDTPRRAYAVLCMAGLGPILAAGLWRPLVSLLGEDPTGLAVRLCVGASLFAVLGALGGRGRGAPLAVVLALFGGLFGVGGLGAALSLGLVAASAAWATPRIRESLPADLDELPRQHPIGAALWTLLVISCMVLATRTAVFLSDHRFGDYSAPAPEFIHYHFCATAYLHAAELLRVGVDNVYDLALVPDEGGHTLPATAAHMAPFALDRYGYPPQFLLAPMAVIRLFSDFSAQRAFWCAVNALFVAYARWRLALWAGPRGGRVMLLGAPILWGWGMLGYQIGNVQALVESLSALAVIALFDGRDRRSGALLAVATLAKIAPGLLGVLMLVQRRWRAVAWTVLWAVGLSALALWVMGWGPFEAFLRVQLPNVSSGAAYDFLDDDRGQIFQNFSPFAIPFKLVVMGASLDAWAWGPKVTSAFTVFVFGLTAVAGLRRPDRRGALAIGLVVFSFACMRSPMAPPYVLTAVQLALLLALAEWEGVRRWVGFLAVSMGTVLFLPNEVIPMEVSLVGQVFVYALMAWLMLRRWAPMDPVE